MIASNRRLKKRIKNSETGQEQIRDSHDVKLQASHEVIALEPAEKEGRQNRRVGYGHNDSRTYSMVLSRTNYSIHKLNAADAVEPRYC